MKPRARFYLTLTFVLMATMVLLVIVLVRPARAGGGIVLRPPFDGTYRVTAYFDHEKPNYGSGADGFIWIYNGERVPASYPNKTGEPYPYDGHDGWDWSMITGTDVLAAAAGTVEVSVDNMQGGYGHTIIIAHGNGYYTMYSHLNARLVEETDPVAAGQHIGESGESGGVPPHLHFGVRHGGYLSTTYAVDPFGWRGSGRDPLFNFNGKESSCLWAGVPGDDVSCADIIVEDAGQGWEQYPTWDNVCSQSSSSWARCERGNGYCYHWTNVWSPPSFWVQWRPWYSNYGQLRYPGYYQIHAFVPTADDSPKAKTSNATYEVRHGRSSPAITYVPVDQSDYSDNWVPLGTYWLWPGQSGSSVSMGDYTGEGAGTREIVADAMKFSASIAYLPDIRNSDGWTSSIAIRNNSATAASVAINYYNSSGDRVSDDIMTVSGNSVVVRTPLSGFVGSATVVSGQDASVVVETKKGSGSDLKAEGYSGFSAGHTRAYFPTVAERSSEWSKISASNVSGETATTKVRLFDRYGNEITAAEQNFTLNPNGQNTVDLRYVGGLPADFLGSAYVTSTGRIVAETVTHFPLSPINDTAAYEGPATGSTGSLYFPQVKRRMFGGNWYDYSGVVIQNLDNTYPASVYVYFYDRNGTLKTSFSDSIPPKSSHGYNTRYYGEAPPDKMIALGDDFNGSVRVVSTGGREIVGVCKTWIEGGVDAIEMHVGEAGGTAELVVLLVYRRTYDGQSADPQNNAAWLAYSGVIVQNLGASTATVTVRFYRQDGSEVTGAAFSDSIPSNSPHGYNTRYYGDAPSSKINALGYSFTGSMHIESTNGQALTAVVDTGRETKAIYYYNAAYR